MNKRNISIITGSRAEFGLLEGIMHLLQADRDIELQLIVTGTHLSENHGFTCKEIEKSGLPIAAKVPLDLSSDSPSHICKVMAQALIGISNCFAALKPDIIVLLGDRYEALATAQAAMLHAIPIAHIHGGEVTVGAIDEAIRHSITKMSHLHFVAAEPYRKRVIQLGEAPERVFTVGAPGLDTINKLDLLDRQALARDLDLPVDRPYLVVTYHPVTLAARSPAAAMTGLFQALDTFTDHLILFTLPNADPGNQVIRSAIQQYVAKQSERCRVHTSLGQLRYLSAVKHADAVVGNSSSGIIEAPFLHTGTVNIGDRQKGRLHSQAVVDCAEEPAAIAAAIRQVLSPPFQASLASIPSVYGDGHSAPRIARVLREFPLAGILQKSFHDL